MEKVFLVVMRVLLVIVILAIITVIILHHYFFPIPQLILARNGLFIALGAIFILSILLSYWRMARLAGQIRNEQYIAIHNNTATLYRINTERAFWPIPYWITERIERGNVTFVKFLSFVLRNTKETVLRDLSTKISSRFKSQLSKVSSAAIAQIITDIRAALGKKKYDEATITKAGPKTNLSAARNLLQEVSDKTLSRFKQEQAALIQEEVGQLLRNIGKQIIKEIGQEDTSSQVDISLLPIGTKFLHDDGYYTHILIEQEPQQRIINFSGGFFTAAGEWNAIRARSPKAYITGRSMSLAFPYLLYLIVFVRGEFSRLHLYYAKKPVTSLQDEIYLPSLPNIYEDCHVCMHGLASHGKSLGDRAREAIGDFWQSEFNDAEFNYHYAPSRRLDKRIANIWHWEKESKKNPLFVLDVNWRPAGKLKDILTAKVGQTISQPVETLQQKLKTAINGSSSEIAERVADRLNGLNTYGQYPKTIASELAVRLQSIAAETTQDMVKELEKTLGAKGGKARRLVSQAINSTLTAALNNEISKAGSEIDLVVNNDIGQLIYEIERETRRR